MKKGVTRMRYLIASLGAFLFIFGILWFAYGNMRYGYVVDVIVWLPAIVCTISGLILLVMYMAEQSNENK